MSALLLLSLSAINFEKEKTYRFIFFWSIIIFIMISDNHMKKKEK
jgi:hypothetical protein